MRLGTAKKPGASVNGPGRLAIFVSAAGVLVTMAICASGLGRVAHPFTGGGATIQK